MNEHPVLKIISREGCRSYLVGCPTTRRALLVDPKHGLQPMVEILCEQLDLELAAVVDTHTHADHLSASADYVRVGLPLHMSSRTAVQRSMHALEDGDEIEVGELRFRVLAVPGHTADSIALVGHGLVLTGDSLLVGGLARADFRGSDPAELFESVRAKILPLPDDTLVLPGHDYGDILFSTVAHEREHNPALQFASGADYAAAKPTVEGAGNSAAVDETLRLNLEADPALPNQPRQAAACCAGGGGPALDVPIAEVEARLADDVLASLDDPEQWIDVRDPHEFAHGRIPGTTNIPLGVLGFHLERLRREGPLYLSCRSGVRSMTAARTLRRLGVALEPINIGGGILAWQAGGLAIDGSPST